LKKLFLWLIIILLALNTNAQNDTTLNAKENYSLRKKLVYIGGASIYTGTMVGLYSMWYKDYPMNGFHFINDNHEWLQMDKLGHATTSYHVGRLGYEAFKWSGASEKTALWVGGFSGSIFLTTIETLDGFSAEWGASPGDLIANTSGSVLFIGQQLLWNEQRIMLKTSFHTTSFAQYRPDLLGSNLPQRLIKDYNGQTYWLSCNIASFLPPKSLFPKWLNIAFGYGAEGMTGSNSNSIIYKGNTIPSFNRYRQYYLSLDIETSRIKPKNRFLKFVLKGISFIKIPFPTLEINSQNQIKGHWLYF
jgi:hypothetical protein